MDQKKLSLKLDSQKRRLEALDHSDMEIAHVYADRILIDTIELLAKAKFGTVPRKVTDIITKYRAIPKWHA